MADLLNVKIGNASFKKFLVELNKRQSPTYDLTNLIPELEILFLFGENPDIIFKEELSNILNQKGGANSKYSQKGGFNQLFLVLLLIIWHFGMSMVFDGQTLQRERESIKKERQQLEQQLESNRNSWIGSFFWGEYSQEVLDAYHEGTEMLDERTRHNTRQFNILENEVAAAADDSRAGVVRAQTAQTSADTLSRTMDYMQQNNNWQFIAGILGGALIGGTVTIGVVILLIIKVLIPTLQNNNITITFGNGNRAQGVELQDANNAIPERSVRNQLREIDNVAAQRDPNSVLLLPPPNPGFNSPRGRRPPSGGRTKHKKGKTRRRTKNYKR
jgi:hypothetical protein